MAKRISWVTIIMVMPVFARLRITESTSLTMVGSSALVGSSKSTISGSIASVRAMATRCWLAAGKFFRQSIGLVGQPDCFQQLHRTFPRLRFGLFPQRTRREHDVLQHREMGEQIELLEHHAHFHAEFRHIGFGVENIYIVHSDFTGVGMFQQVQAAQESALSCGQPQS